MAEQQGYKRLVPIYRENEDTIQTLIGTAWVHYSDNDPVKDNKERLVSMEMLGLKLDSADKHYAFWSGVIDNEGKTVLKKDIPDPILRDLYWA